MAVEAPFLQYSVDFTGLQTLFICARRPLQHPVLLNFLFQCILLQTFSDISNHQFLKGFEPSGSFRLKCLEVCLNGFFFILEQSPRRMHFSWRPLRTSRDVIYYNNSINFMQGNVSYLLLSGVLCPEEI